MCVCVYEDGVISECMTKLPMYRATGLSCTVMVSLVPRLSPQKSYHTCSPLANMLDKLVFFLSPIHTVHLRATLVPMG